jgi:hypothetical protein
VDQLLANAFAALPYGEEPLRCQRERSREARVASR